MATRRERPRCEVGQHAAASTRPLLVVVRRDRTSTSISAAPGVAPATAAAAAAASATDPGASARSRGAPRRRTCREDAREPRVPPRAGERLAVRARGPGLLGHHPEHPRGDVGGDAEKARVLEPSRARSDGKSAVSIAAARTDRHSSSVIVHCVAQSASPSASMSTRHNPSPAAADTHTHTHTPPPGDPARRGGARCSRAGAGRALSRGLAVRAVGGVGERPSPRVRSSSPSSSPRRRSRSAASSRARRPGGPRASGSAELRRALVRRLRAALHPVRVGGRGAARRSRRAEASESLEFGPRRAATTNERVRAV